MSVWKSPLPAFDQLNALGVSSMPGRLGIEFTGAGDDWLRARMPVDDRTRQPWGRLHGGASVALAETVASVGAMLTLDAASKGAVGLEINANHVRPATSGFVHAEAHAENIGRTTQIWSFRIVDDAGRLICIGRITIAVIDRDAGRPAEPINAEAPQRSQTFLGELIARARENLAPFY